MEKANDLINTLNRSSDQDIIALIKKLEPIIQKIPELNDISLLQFTNNRIESLSTIVENKFPVPYNSIYRKVNVQFQNCLEANINPNFVPSYQESACSFILTVFDHTKQVIDFFPFVFIQSLNNMDKGKLKLYANDRLNTAIKLFERLYHTKKPRDERNQVQLISELLCVFKILYSENECKNDSSFLTDRFILNSLFTTEDKYIKKDFDNIFPDKFIEILHFFVDLKNILTHENFPTKNKVDTFILVELSYAAFLELINILVPIFRSFGLVYINSIESIGTDFKQVFGYKLYLDKPEKVSFLIEGFPNPSNQAFKNYIQHDHIYIVNNNKERKKGTLERIQLLPMDYLDLTPYLIYTTLLEENTPNSEEKIVFPSVNSSFVYSFDGSIPDENLFKIIQYQQLTGDLKKVLLRKSEIQKNEKNSLIQFFKYCEEAYSKLKYFSSDEEEFSNLIEKLYLKTWFLSKDHISPFLDFDNYNIDGGRKSNSGTSLKNLFSNTLFEKPNASSFFEEFFKSTSRGLILTGKSGYGKSYLLIYHFLQNRQSGNIALFINARNLYKPNIKSYLFDQLNEIHAGLTIDELNRLLSENKKCFYIYIDAINEYNNDGGPIELLRKVISLVNDADFISNAKIICSVRNETWKSFLDESVIKERPLDQSLFFSPDGNPIPVEGFENENIKKRLYQRYQKYFNLKPLTYESLDANIKNLIGQPFMMSVIAHTYANNRIPTKGTNFYLLFHALTERKLSNAVVNYYSNKKADLKIYLKKCLEDFAEILYDKIATDFSKTKDKVDSLNLDWLKTKQDFNTYLKNDKDYLDTILSILVQNGLIEQTETQRYDFFGNNLHDPEFSYKYFHDQYSQFWLSKVLEKKNELYFVTSALLADDQFRNDLVRKIKQIIDKGKNSPVLLGALDHWFYNNMTLGNKVTVSDYLLILFSSLIKKEDVEDTSLLSYTRRGFYYYYIGSFLRGLVEKNIVTPKELFGAVFQYNDENLNECITDNFLNSFNEIIVENCDQQFYKTCFLSLLLNCKSTENDILSRKMADVFSDLFNQEPLRIINFFNDAFTQLSQLNIIVNQLVDPGKIQQHLNFLVKFFIKVAISNIAKNNKNLLLIRSFFQEKYELIPSSTFSEYNISFIRKTIKSEVIKTLDLSGEDQWRQGIGNRNTGREINNQFYIPVQIGNDKIIQRDLLFELYPYLVDIHNGDYSRLDLINNLIFKNIIIKAISYNKMSIVGYVGVLIVGQIINNIEEASIKKETLEDIINELLASGEEAAIDFIPLLLDILAKIHKDDTEFSKVLLSCYTIIVNRILDDKNNLSYAYYFADTPGLDINIITNWKEYYKPIFDLIINRVYTEEDAERINSKIIYICFLPDINIGIRVIRYFLEIGVYKNKVWYRSTMRLLAAMYIRNKKLLFEVIDSIDIDKVLVNETEITHYIDEAMFKLRDARSYQANWNEVFVYAFNINKKLGYYVIRDLIGGLITTRRIEDMAKEYRRFVLNALEDFLGYAKKTNNFNYLLTVEEALALCPFYKETGPGEYYKN